MEGGSSTDLHTSADPPIEGEAVLPESLRLHATIPTQTAAKFSKYHRIQPKNAVTRTGTIAFEISSGDNRFIDPSSAVLLIECSIRDNRGNIIPMLGPPPHGGGDPPLNDRTKVYPVNGLGYSLFTNVKVLVNGTTIDAGDTLYSYRGDFETRLSYPKSVKEGSLNMTGFDEETAAFDDANLDDVPYLNLFRGTALPNAQGYPALMRRLVRAGHSKPMFLMTPIHSELFDQGKWLPPHTKISVTLEQNKAAFSILSKNVDGVDDNSYRVEIEKCEMMIRMVGVDSNVSEEIRNVSYTGASMLFPMRRVKMEQHRIPANMRDLSVTNVLVGETELPRRLFVAFVRHDAAMGTLGRDPYNYQDFGLARIGLRVGGVERPYPMFTVNFETGEKIEPLWALLETTGFCMGDQELGFDYDTYSGRNCFFGFDLTSTRAPPGMCYESAASEDIEIVANLREAKAFPLEVILYAEYDAEMEIQPSKKVVMHTNA